MPEGPPLTALGSALIEVYGPKPGYSRWENSLWGAGEWAAVGWNDVTPQSLSLKITWGADNPAGVLTTSASGSWTIDTYDPERLLDPSNGSSPYSASLRPGRPMRISYVGTLNQRVTVRLGLIDEIEYDLDTNIGSIRGTDAIQLMNNAKLLGGQQSDLLIPNTLRARAKYLVDKVGLDNLVIVEGERDYDSTVALGDPALYWQFDEGTIAVGPIDRTANANDGEYVDNDVITLGQQSLIAGDNPCVFMGVDSYVEIHPSILLTQWTVNLWLSVAPGAVTADATFIGRNSNNATNVTIRNSDKHIIITGQGGTTYCESTIPYPIDGNAHMVTISRSGGFVYIRLDGVDVTNQIVTPYVAQNVLGQPYILGAKTTGNSGNQGLAAFYDAAALYLRNMGADECAVLYSVGKGIEGKFDPPVGPVLDSEASLWTHITTAAYDALYATWIDGFNTLRFRSFGDPRDVGFKVGGTDPEAIAIDTMKTQGSMQSVFTHIIGYDVLTPTVAVEASDVQKIDIYGDLLLRRQQPVPNAQAWVDSVLADRSGAALQYSPGTLRPQTDDQFLSILQLGMIDVAHLAVESVSPTIEVSARILGGTLLANTESGWSAEIITYIPGSEWTEAETPELPPEPEPPDTTVVVRNYACTADSRLAHSSSLDAGSGVDDQIVVGYVGGYRNRMAMKFASIPFAGVVRIDKAELLLTTTTEVCCQFGSSPKVTAKRITGSWSEGTYSAACGFSTGNAVKYPGPATTSTGAVSKSVSGADNAAVTIDVTAIARAWQAGSAQNGIMLVSAGEDSSAYTTEFHSRHQGTTARRPSLRLTLTVEV